MINNEGLGSICKIHALYLWLCNILPICYALLSLNTWKIWRSIGRFIVRICHIRIWIWVRVLIATRKPPNPARGWCIATRGVPFTTMIWLITTRRLYITTTTTTTWVLVTIVGSPVCIKQACNCPIKKKEETFEGTMQARSEAAKTPRDMRPTMVP